MRVSGVSGSCGLYHGLGVNRVGFLGRLLFFVCWFRVETFGTLVSVGVLVAGFGFCVFLFVDCPLEHHKDGNRGKVDLYLSLQWCEPTPFGYPEPVILCSLGGVGAMTLNSARFVHVTCREERHCHVLQSEWL